MQPCSRSGFAADGQGSRLGWTLLMASAVYRNEDSADAFIRPVAELPNAQALRASQGLGHLRATGWIEDILAFSESELGDGNLEHEGRSS